MPQSISNHFGTLVSSPLTWALHAWLGVSATLCAAAKHCIYGCGLKRSLFSKIKLYVAADLTLSSRVWCSGRCLSRLLRRCFVLSRPIRATLEYLCWWYHFKLAKTSPTLPTLPDQMGLDKHPWPLTLDPYLIFFFYLENHSWNG